MEITTGATARGSNFQNNVTSNVNIGGGHFSHFGTVGANLFRGFRLLEEAIIIHLQKITIIHYQNLEKA